MRHFISYAAIVALFSMAQAFGEEATVDKPTCPPDPRTEDVPELLYTFDDFDHDSFIAAIDAMRIKVPESIENRDAWLRKHHADDEDRQIFEGELSMMYSNLLAVIEGYTLKLEYLAAGDSERAEKEKLFCDFIKNNIIID